MKCLTEQECGEWLRNAGLIERPYELPELTSCSFNQFEPPKESRRLFAFLRTFLPILSGKGEILLHVIDTEIPYSEQFALLNAIRHRFGEQRDIVEAPGFLFSAEEHDFCLGVFGLTTEFAWEAYAYFQGTKDVLLNWEGDLMDWWCFDDCRFKEGQCVIQSFKLRETEDDPA